MSNSPEKSKLPVGPRILLGVAAIPCLVLAGMLTTTLITDGLSDIGAFEVVYAGVGFIALYIAVTGKRLF